MAELPKIANNAYAVYPSGTEIALECFMCKTKNFTLYSVAGSPWQLQCSNGHPWILTTDDVTIEMENESLGEVP